MKKNNLKTQQGITIIALTITIIVLLILAGVSIAFLTGDNQIIGKSQESKKETEIMQYQEKLEILKQLESTNNYTADVDQFMDNYVEVVAKDAMFKENKGITPDSNKKVVTVVTKEGYEFEVTMDDVIYVGDKDEGGNEGGNGDGNNNGGEDNNEEVAGLTFSTDYGTIDVIWLDINNNVISKPNIPQLTSNGESLVPVKWNSLNNIVETTASDTNWYNYSENRWANAKAKNGSYFVWIPRYAYRITYYSDPDYKNLTGYYDGRGQWKADTREVRVALDSGIETVNYNGEKYIVHPAFETNLDNGGWDKDLAGIWVAKFEANGIGKDLKFTYGVPSVRSQTIGMQYTSARQATYGYIGQKGEDGNTSFMNSHMMKNSEWGAVAYLTHSKYGLNGKEIKANNNSSYYTGGGIGEEYKSNTNQSTTGNVYGIYDLSGGAWERISTFNSTDINEDFLYFQWTEATGLTTDSESTKYATKYYNETDFDGGNKITYTVGKVGDATKEVNTGGIADKNDTKNFNNWFSDYPYFVYSTSPFFGRGGTYANGDGAGIFYMDHVMGTSHNISFRASLAF